MPEERINKLVNACINWHVAKASVISFATGLPGGWAMVLTVPADVAQFFRYVILLAQKLAYLEGPPTVLEEGRSDEVTEMEITLLVGVMMGSEGAATACTHLAKRVAEKVAKDLPKKALTKTTFYPAVKSVGKLIGVRVTKSSFGRIVGKAIPVLGGVVSAGVTVATMRPMAFRLRNHFRGMSEIKAVSLGVEGAKTL